jgi:hypothetical protein
MMVVQENLLDEVGPDTPDRAETLAVRFEESMASPPIKKR